MELSIGAGEPLADRLQIADITLKSIVASLGEDVLPGTPATYETLDGAYQLLKPHCVSWSLMHDETSRRYRFVFEVKAAIRIFAKDTARMSAEFDADDASVTATIETVFLAAYDVEGDEQPQFDDPSIGAFQRQSVPFNVWPYWREVVQSASARMGFPRLVLPPLRLRKSATQASPGPALAIEAPIEPQ